MKLQALFSSNNKSEKLKCRLLQFSFVALSVNFDSLLNLDQLLTVSFLYVYKYLLFAFMQIGGTC